MFPFSFEDYKNTLYNELKSLYPNLNLDPETSVLRNNIIEPILEQIGKIYEENVIKLSAIEDLMYGSSNESSGVVLDFLASLYGIKRKQGTKTTGILRVKIPLDFYDIINVEGIMKFSELQLNINGKKFYVPEIIMTKQNLNQGYVFADIISDEIGDIYLPLNENIKFSLSIIKNDTLTPIEVEAEIIDKNSGIPDETDENLRSRIETIRQNIFLNSVEQIEKYFESSSIIKKAKLLEPENSWNLYGISYQFQVSDTGEILDTKITDKKNFSYNLKIYGPVKQQIETIQTRTMDTNTALELNSRVETFVKYFEENFEIYNKKINPYEYSFIDVQEGYMPLLTGLKYIKIEGPLLYPVSLKRVQDNVLLEYGNDYIMVIKKPQYAFSEFQETFFIFKDTIDADIEILYIKADFMSVKEELKKMPFISNTLISYFNPIVAEYLTNETPQFEITDMQNPNFVLRNGIDIPENIRVIQTKARVVFPTGGITTSKIITNGISLNNIFPYFGIAQTPPFAVYSESSLIGGV